ncbi:MAG: NADH-quinone oxidoreductase subunit NuoH [Planctomycetes bacterium]|nr:NADH-quinone oxidoreductase subunit NuoH [Planctomycetota bacterium]
MPGLKAFLDGWVWVWPWERIITELMVALIVLHFFALSPVLLIWLERKISGRMQSRLGPMHVGAWHGWLQTLADGIKLILKEDVIPTGADRLLHTIGPILVVMTAVTAFVVIPFGNELIPRDFNIGLLYILAITSVGIFGIVIAGWASNNKYSLLGGMRSAAQLVSYEIPRALAIVGVIMLAGTLQMSEIVRAQSGGVVTDAVGGLREIRLALPYLLIQPIAFVLFFIASVAETNRVPFDLPEAESELVAGFHTEYSGMKFAFFFMAEYGNMLLFSCLATALFLGGGSVPFIEGHLQYATQWLFGALLPGVTCLNGFWHFGIFMVKTYVLVFVFIWIRWTYPRMRVDRLMDFSWKILVPWTFANLVFLGLAMVFRERGGLWIFAVVNWMIVIVILKKALGSKKNPVPAAAQA